MSFGENRLREEARIAQAIMRFAQIRERMANAKLKELKPVAHDRMYRLAIASEGLGLFGDQEEMGKNGVTLKDLKLYEELISIVESALDVCDPDEIPEMMRILDEMTMNMWIRSRRLLSVEASLPIQSILGRFPELKYEGMDKVQLGEDAGQSSSEGRAD